ncbi:hypothetical protein [Marinomonas ostreistagni]|uniref:hypothetical protein n=1 Tax=Marinomonas ostreistagni TaxID=359209 RepID=UPI0019524456|nr:hypothetical protein [Marinomonas ostreistagni]MBM6549698.1 hypothetical protein [Marinomonas ostreistagni]
MQITNSGALNYGQMGLQRSQNNLDQASAQVASASTQLASVNNTNGTTNAGAEIRDGLVNANISELNAKANAKVIGAADDMLGTLIDIKV